MQIPKLRSQSRCSGEEYVHRMLRHLGPVVCLASPDDPVGAGAALRMSAPPGWEARVLQLLNECSYAVIVAANTKAVMWEVEQAFQRLERHQILLILPFGTTLSDEYEQFRQNVNRFLPAPLPARIGQPAVVAFSPFGDPLLFEESASHTPVHALALSLRSAITQIEFRHDGGVKGVPGPGRNWVSNVASLQVALFAGMLIPKSSFFLSDPCKPIVRVARRTWQAVDTCGPNRPEHPSKVAATEAAAFYARLRLERCTQRVLATKGGHWRRAEFEWSTTFSPMPGTRARNAGSYRRHEQRLG